MPEYNAMELMIVVAARTLENGATVAVGTGAPCAAAMLAQKTHSPDLVIAFESGGLAPLLPRMPISVGDSRSFYRALMASSMCEIMETCQRGLMDYTFLGGAQIDAYGNLNSTVVGDYLGGLRALEAGRSITADIRLRSEHPWGNHWEGGTTIVQARVSSGVTSFLPHPRPAPPDRRSAGVAGPPPGRRRRWRVARSPGPYRFGPPVRS